MIVYQSPGVYIQEVPAGPQPIAAASTSVLAIVGTTQRGPFREPTRVTGWPDFHAMFGDLVDGLFTPESMYGFFENGGPAAWVVRVDPSTTTEWSARRADAAEVFDIRAASPGEWANAMTVSVSPDLTAGGGRLFAADAVVAAAANVAAGADRQLELSSTAGLAVGDAVSIVTPDAAAAATVKAVDAAARKVTLTLGTTAVDLVPGATWVGGAVAATDTVIRLASGGGIRRGDVVRLVPASRQNPRSAFVAAAAGAQPGLALTVSDLSGAVAAVEFAPRVERFTALVAAAPPGTNLPFTGITSWEQAPAPATGDVLAGFTAAAADGGVGTWSTTDTRWNFPGPVPAGRVEVEAVVTAARFTDGPLSGPTTADLTARYSFFPTGSTLRLHPTGGGAVTNLVRTDTSWTGTLPAGDWDRVEFVPGNDSTKGLILRAAFAPRVGEFLRIGTNNARIAAVTQLAEGLYDVRTATAVDASGTAGPYQVRAFQPTQVVPVRFRISVAEGGAEVESYPGLALHPDHPSYYFRDDVVNDVSTRIQVTERAPGAINLAAFPAVATRTATGVSAAATANDIKQGFRALERVTEPAMVACPDATGLDEAGQADVIGAMLTHCEEFRRFAIVDAPDGLTETELADWRLRTVTSVQAAVYAPWVSIVNLDSTSPRRVVNVPPSGFVAGVFARTDRERGVHKAPANERVRGIVGLAADYTQRDQDLLNPAGVNLIRTFAGRGTRIWGARNATDDAQWRYVNVRRLFNLIENSVERSTQWVVFEPNTPSTWLRIRVSVENFLEQLWRSGALAGVSPEQAYRVRVGLGETMTETDIDLGLVVTEVAVAPAKPAEFVVFRFSHKRITE